mmetsp:Transcript_23800/g.52404  ORF Transcript_23800/g.52404 Transcript_23800/m.52404 type:complete len:222 (-) Transcript_23800:708-1373(-)
MRDQVGALCACRCPMIFVAECPGTPWVLMRTLPRTIGVTKKLQRFRRAGRQELDPLLRRPSTDLAQGRMRRGDLRLVDSTAVILRILLLQFRVMWNRRRGRGLRMTSLVLGSMMPWPCLRQPRWLRKEGLVSFSFSGQLCRGLSASRTSLSFQGPAATQENPISVSKSLRYSAKAPVEIRASTIFQVHHRLRTRAQGPTRPTSTQALRWRVKVHTMWHRFP